MTILHVHVTDQMGANVFAHIELLELAVVAEFVVNVLVEFLEVVLVFFLVLFQRVIVVNGVR